MVITRWKFALPLPVMFLFSSAKQLRDRLNSGTTNRRGKSDTGQLYHKPICADDITGLFLL